MERGPIDCTTGIGCVRAKRASWVSCNLSSGSDTHFRSVDDDLMAPIKDPLPFPARGCPRWAAHQLWGALRSCLCMRESERASERV